MSSHEITRTIIIKGSPEEIYRMWADYEKHPQFSENLKSVEMLDDKRSHWVMSGPLGKEISWTAETTRDDEGRRLAWRTIEGDIKISGQVTFAELSHNETQVMVKMNYVPPAGKLGDIAAKIFANPDEKVEKDLRMFKEYAEKVTGKNVKRV
jgi:uncharacterized membrane protein